jgi:ribosomal protein S18 acetylase RimI-like enzyme
MNAAHVEMLAARDADDVAATLADAFADYPVMRFVLGAQGFEHHDRLVRMFVMARVLRGEPLLGIREGARLVGAAIASYPGAPAPETFLTLRTDTWRVIGAEAEARYTAYTEATKVFAFPAGAVHLNMIGARKDTQRRGLGRSLLDAVQAISRARPGSPGVELTTETPANVAYYTLLGFQQVGHAVVGPGLESWGFFRPNEPPYAPIDCSLHDRLEAAATIGGTVTLTYAGPDGREEVRSERIVTVDTRDGAEYAGTSSGLEIRLDRILDVDGISFRPDRR